MWFYSGRAPAVAGGPVHAKHVGREDAAPLAYQSFVRRRFRRCGAFVYFKLRGVESAERATRAVQRLAQHRCERVSHRRAFWILLSLSLLLWLVTAMRYLL